MPSEHPSLLPSSPYVVPSLTPSTSTILSLSRNFSVAPLEWVYSKISIDMKIDDYPFETTWCFYKSNNNMIPIYSGGTHTNSFTNHVFEAGLNEGSCEFKILDTCEYDVSI